MKDENNSERLSNSTTTTMHETLPATNLKQVKEAGQESDRRLADIIDFLPDATFAIDLSGKVIVWNRAMEEMTEVKAVDILGKGDYEYSIPFYGMRRPMLIDLVFTAPENEKQYYAATRTGNTLLIEADVTLKGVSCVLWGKAGPLYDSHGNITGAIQSVRDISRIKQTEEALKKAHDELELRVQERTDELMRANKILQAEILERKHAELMQKESEEKFAESFLKSPIPMAITAMTDGRYIEVNETFAHVMGLKREELIGNTSTDIGYITEEHRKLFLEQYRREGFVRNLALPVRVKGGEVKYGLFNSSKITIRGEDFFLTMVTDITELKEADDALQRGRTLLQSLIDNTPALIYAIDTKGRIIIANKAFGDLLGRKPSEIIGKRRREFLPPDIASRDDANDREVLSVGHSLEFEERGTFNEEETTFLTTKAPLQDQDGKIWGVTVISTDITERKRADEALKIKSADLLAVNRELESFAYSISHDLRAPLRAIDGFSRIILKKYSADFDEDVIDKFNIIRSNAQIMSQLIDDILALSRLSREKMSLTPVNMADIINAVWNELLAINPERKMELIIKDAPPVLGDQTLLKQVYANLLGNAVKFTRKRDTALIEAGGYRKGNENVYYVKDNGAGFNMEYQSKLFRVFQRLHPASEFEGTGIGLSIVSRIISRHGGSVWAEGKEDEGAVFYFTIPSRKRSTARPAKN